MTRVALITVNENFSKKVQVALEGKSYELVLFEGSKRDNEDYYKFIIASKASLVICDYCLEDAASVKLMQSFSDLPFSPSFIFLDHEEKASRSEVLLALNEGAESFLPSDFKPEALRNYIERAVKGPGRLRWKDRLRDDDCDSKLEEIIGTLRIKGSRYQKLISYLLSHSISHAARKALVVSDSPFQRDLLKQILEEYGFICVVASDYDDALKLAEAESPRSVISDLELAGRTGLELCRAIKFDLKIIPCHFVVCTASPDKAGQILTPGNGVDDCLLKPLGRNNADDFISRVALGFLA